MDQLWLWIGFNLFVLVMLALWATFGGVHAPAVAAGFFVGYMIYDEMHYALHHHTPKSRLGKRLRATGCTTYGAYCALLSGLQGAEEINNLVDAISTNHTFFFRERKHFDFLEQTVLPDFHKNPQFRRLPGLFRTQFQDIPAIGFIIAYFKKFKQ
mgnify:CR=1 FL=1